MHWVLLELERPLKHKNREKLVANLITLSRLILLSIVIAFMYTLPPAWQFVSLVLLIMVFVSDGLDGYVARKRGESSQFGAVFDIAADRIVELAMWIVFVDLQLVAFWVPLVFIVRGGIVDAIRSTQATEHHQSPFSMITSDLGKILVSGKFMRIFYAVIKAVAFCWLLLVYAIPEALPSLWSNWSGAFLAAADVFVLSSVFLCLLRGAPVIIEYVYSERHTILNFRPFS